MEYVKVAVATTIGVWADARHWLATKLLAVAPSFADYDTVVSRLTAAVAFMYVLLKVIKSVRDFKAKDKDAL